VTIREAAVAGLFYPAKPMALRAEVDQLLRDADPRHGMTPKVLIVPHAGYVYSGAVAAEAYRLLEPLRRIIRRVVMLGPAHRHFLDGMALPAADYFRTPLGAVPLDGVTMAELARLPGVGISDLPHQDEHCLEVQLPFLQQILDDFDLVPLLVGHCDPDRVATVLDTAWGGGETLIVISSDLSHYLPYADARRTDRDTSKRILQKSATLSGDHACGAYALNGLLRSRRCAGLDVELVDLRNSGDTAGDKSRVVGYGAFVFH